MMSALEAQSIAIMREAVAAAQNPVMMYSAGKDSSVMLHLARKAFFPSTPPFPLLHIDTTWKFKEMYAHRDRAVRESGMKLVVYSNPEGLADNVTPFTHDSEHYTDIMKTQALRQALDRDQYDVIFGGARRDEEKSRAKERIFSFRKSGHQWDAKNQRPELWDLYNTHKRQGETMRVFPLSNWTELDIWLYIYAEKIPLVPLYFAAERNVVLRNGQLIMVDDERFELRADEVVKRKKVRFRTLGCYPLTAAVESEADTIESIIWETFGARTSERSGRLIDADSPGSMEKKKQAGYF